LSRGPPTVAPAGRARSPLARRYALLLCGLTLLLLVVSGGWQMLFSYREARGHIEALQAAQAQAAAREIATYLRTIEVGLRDVAKMPWGRPGYSVEQRREEFYRLMQLVPAVIELQAVDRGGRETLYVSKQADDRLASGVVVEDAASLLAGGGADVRRGRTSFRDGYLPTLRLAADDGQGAVVATVDLRLLGEIVSRLRAGVGGLAYIVDDRGGLIAHPRPTEALRRLDLSSADVVRQARGAASSVLTPVVGLETRDLAGQPVIATAARVPDTGWIVVMEQQRAVALQPVLDTLQRTLLLLAVGVVVATAAGVVFARRMAAPIVALRRATARIASGDLEAASIVRSGDEIEDLAEDFNRMAGHLRESYATLESRVEERTAQLSDARDVLAARSSEIAALNERLMAQLDELAHRRDEAERANAAKTRFLATASHDLRQPMHSIGLLLGLLRDRLGEAPLVDLADKAQASVSTMEGLFNSLLDISQLDAGGVRPVVEPIDLAQLLQRIGQAWAPQAAERGLVLRVRASAFEVQADVALVERMVGNLLSNALRYTRQGGVLLTCRRRGAGCVLQVWDTGPGIEERWRQAIFDEFFRIDAHAAGGEKGLGLGLSIVQRSARLLGCELGLQSRVGRGSVFSLAWPQARAARPLPVPGHAPAADHRAAVAGSFIAVVDDDEDNRVALSGLLRNWGCHVLAAASCAEALAGMQQHLRAPDLLITDHQLGDGADGLALIVQLRQQQDEPVPALVVTANTDERVARDAATLGATVLHKPVGQQRLAAAIVAALQRPA